MCVRESGSLPQGVWQQRERPLALDRAQAAEREVALTAALLPAAWPVCLHVRLQVKRRKANTVSWAWTGQQKATLGSSMNGSAGWIDKEANS